jgi:glycosyltransferase involved in cell wall biosynthesis
MRIVQLTETLHAGGAETFVVRLSNALAEAGHEVTLAVALPVIHPAVRDALDPRVAIVVLPLPRWRWWSKAESALRRAGLTFRPLHRRQTSWLKGLIRTVRPDAIHSHLLKADLIAMEAKGAAPGARHVVTVHGDYPMYLAGEADPFLRDAEKHMRMVAAGADGIVGVAAGHLALFRDRLGSDAGRLHLVYNGYPELPASMAGRKELGLPEGKFLFGMVARGIESKGWGEAIAAFRELGRDDAALVLVGEGPFLDGLRAGNAGPATMFTGFSARPLDMIRHFDVGLLPSNFGAESLPTVIIEYLLCGKPVIASDVGEIAAMLAAPDGGAAGEVIPLQNGRVPVDVLAESMRRMLDAAEHRAALAANARPAFAKFAMDECVRRYVDLYAGASSSNKARH